MGDVASKVECGICGVQKKVSNRWVIVWVNNLREFCAAEFNQIVWEGLKQRYQICDVACGEGHAQQFFSRWLTWRLFEAPPPNSSAGTRSHGSGAADEGQSQAPGGSAKEST